MQDRYVIDKNFIAILAFNRGALDAGSIGSIEITQVHSSINGTGAAGV